ncbi:MAG: hypothetical protein LLG00_00050 [Planctomycetaceae bacterium]|nr:hypothetical protein [Planctomycetaceae bacterium]
MPPWHTASPYVAAAILFAIVLIGFAYVYAFGVDVPWYDEWIVPILMQEHARGGVTLDFLWQQHNEHRIFFPSLLFLGIALLTNGSIFADMYVSQGLLCLSLAILFAACRRQASLRRALWTTIPIALLLFSLRQWENMLWGFQLTFIMVVCCALLTFFCLSRLCEDRWRLGFAAAAIAATIAIYSSLQGIFVWPVGVAQLVVAPLNNRRKTALLTAWSAIGIAEWALYFHHWHTVSIHPTFQFSARYFLTMVGSALCYAPQLALAAGILLATLTAMTLAVVGYKRQWQEQSFWLALIAFAILVLAAITLGRTGCGLDRAMNSRYTLYSLLLIIGIYGIGALQKRSEPRGISRYLARITLDLAVFGVAACFVEGLTVGQGLHDQREYERFLLYTSDMQPDEALTFFPLHDANGKIDVDQARRVREWISVMRQFRSGVFADVDWSARQELPNPALPIRTSPTRFAIDPIHPIYYWAGIDVLSISGWAVDFPANAVAGSVAIVLDGKTYPAHYGDPVHDVATQFSNPQLANCGFRCYLLLKDIQPGDHVLTLKIRSHDGQSVYLAPHNLNIDPRFNGIAKPRKKENSQAQSH